MIRVLLLAAAVAPAADPLPTVEKAEPLPAWDAKFRRTDGWVGGDGAYSVPLSDTRAVWLFGDTWIGSVRGGKRVKVKMVNNTVAVQESKGDAATLTFPIRRDGDTPRSHFAPPRNGDFVWPQAGIHL